MPFPTYKNIKAPDLSNLVQLQSEGSHNAFNSLANIGNTIQGIQQKNTDRDNRNLLAQGMLANLNQDVNTVKSTFAQAVNNSNFPIDFLSVLGKNVQKNINTEELIKKQDLARKISQSSTKNDNITLDNYRGPIPKDILNNNVTENNDMVKALENNFDKQMLIDANDPTNPTNTKENLNTLGVEKFNTPGGVNSFTDEQDKASKKVQTQKQTILNNNVQSSIDTAYNQKSPNYKPISFRGNTSEDVVLNNIDDINAQNYSLIKKVQNFDITPLEKQKYVTQIDKNTNIIKKKSLISLVEKGYLDPSSYPQILTDTGFNNSEIENLYKNYNTKNINFGKDIDPTNPVYPVFQNVQDTLTTYEASKIKERETDEYKLVDSLKNADAFKGDSSVDSVNIFMKKYKDSVTEGQLRTAIERIQDKIGNTLTLPEILSAIDYGAESTAYYESGSTSIDSWVLDMFVNKGIKKFNPEMKTELLKNKEVSDQKDFKVKVKIQELHNLKKQFFDPTNKITKSIVKDKIEILSKELQKLTNPQYSSEILTKKITGN